MDQERRSNRRLTSERRISATPQERRSQLTLTASLRLPFDFRNKRPISAIAAGGPKSEFYDAKDIQCIGCTDSRHKRSRCSTGWAVCRWKFQIRRVVSHLAKQR